MDVVERLRELNSMHTPNEFHNIGNEAADEIERLRTGNRLHLELAEIQNTEIERLREALRPFAKIADDYETLHDEDYVSVHRHDIELRHFRAIRTALQQKESE